MKLVNLLESIIECAGLEYWLKLMNVAKYCAKQFPWETSLIEWLQEAGNSILT